MDNKPKIIIKINNDNNNFTNVKQDTIEQSKPKIVVKINNKPKINVTIRNFIWFCYVLYSLRPDYTWTYIGMTNDLHHRLRQHNGEIVGGAKKTLKGRPWAHVCYISGLETKSIAQQLEWRLQHPGGKPGKKRGPKTKQDISYQLKVLEKVLNLDKWTAKSPVQNELFLTIHWCINPPRTIKIPSHYQQIFNKI